AEGAPPGHESDRHEGARAVRYSASPPSSSGGRSPLGSVAGCSRTCCPAFRGRHPTSCARHVLTIRKRSPAGEGTLKPGDADSHHDTGSPWDLLPGIADGQPVLAVRHDHDRMTQV